MVDDVNNLNANLTELIKAAAVAASSKDQQFNLLQSLTNINNLKTEGLVINNFEKRKSISSCNNMDSYQNYLEQSSNHSNDSLKNNNSCSNNKNLNIQIPNSPIRSSAASSPITSSSLSPNPSNTSL